MKVSTSLITIANGKTLQSLKEKKVMKYFKLIFKQETSIFSVLNAQLN